MNTQTLKNSPTILSLRDPATLDIVTRGIDAMIRVRAVTDAFDFIIAFVPQLHASKLADDAPQLYARYEELIAKARWVALPLASEKEIVELFERHVLLTFTLNVLDFPSFDLWECFQAKLRNLLLILERNQLKQQVKTALLRNTEPITKKTVILDEKEIDGTIANWFRDYNREVGMGIVDRVKQSQYFAQGKNFNRLEEEEKKRLQIIFNFYEKLKFASDTPEGFEDVIGVDDEENRGVLREGAFESVDSVVEKKLQEKLRFIEQLTSGKPVVEAPVLSSSVMSRARIVSVTADDARAKKIDAARARLRGTGKEAVVLFFDLLSHPQGMTPATAEELTAGLMILGEDNALERAITDTKIRELFLAYLKSKNQPDLLEGFRLTPTMPKFMSIFLQWVLQEKGKLSENDAAQIGARIGNMLKKRGNEKYARIAYFDAASGQFRWS